MPALLHFVTPKTAVAVAVAVAVGAAGYVYVSTSQKPAGTYVTPTVGPLVQQVSASGAVKAAVTVGLAFQTSGSIANPGPAVGTHVTAGQTLATLSSADLHAALEQAKAALKVQQADLASLKSGATPQNVAVSQAAVAGAETSVAQEKAAVVQAVEDAYVKADDAIHNRVDQFMNNPRTSTPTLVFTLSDAQLQNSIDSGRVAMEGLLTAWQGTIAALPSDPSKVDTASLAQNTRGYLTEVSTYLDKVASGLTQVITTTSYPLATVQGYQSSIAVARTNISAALSALNAADTAEKSAESSLASAQAALTLKQAPPTADQLAAKEAEVAAAQANVDAAQAQLDKAIITAPITGTITVNSANAGEVVTPGSPVISMVSDTKFQFDMYVSQNDLAKVQVGQSASVTLDAYPGSPLPAHVTIVDPAATEVNGASAYKVTLQFDSNDPRIRAGLTGNAAITTASLSNVLSVPSSAVITQGAQHFVLRKGPRGYAQVPVQVGITSPSGYTQVLSGVSANDEIRTFGTTQ